MKDILVGGLNLHVYNRHLMDGLDSHLLHMVTDFPIYIGYFNVKKNTLLFVENSRITRFNFQHYPSFL